MDLLKVMLAGVLMGLSTIINGLSAGVLAVSLGIYEDIIEALSNIFKNFKKNIGIILAVLIGALVAYFVLGELVLFTLENYPLITVLFFCGVIFGGLPSIIKKTGGEIKRISNLVVFILAFLGILSLSFLSAGNAVELSELGLINYVMLFVMGVVIAATLLVPGVTTGGILMFFGYYTPIWNALYELRHLENFRHNLLIIAPVLLGILIGLGLVANIIRFLMAKCKNKTYVAMLGIILASFVSIFVKTSFPFEVGHTMIGAIMFAVGFVIAVKLSSE